MTKKAKDLKKNDVTEWYTVLEVRVTSTKVIAIIRYNDGGDSQRVWDNPDTLVEVKD